MYVYVDGESHFIRSEVCWKKLRGNAATLEILAETNPSQKTIASTSRHFPKGWTRRFSLLREASFFWDSLLTGIARLGPRVSRAVYVTACSGDDPKIHAAKVAIRENGFEPVVIRETEDMGRQREHRRKQRGTVEKAKGVDIALTVRMLEDAYRNLYDVCLLCTSDADYIPLIEAVRRTGKVVYVLGYRHGMAEKSPFEHVPDRFIDLDEVMADMEWSGGEDRGKIDGIGRVGVLYEE